MRSGGRILTLSPPENPMPATELSRSSQGAVSRWGPGQETTDFLLEHESGDFLDQLRGFPVSGLNRPGGTVGLVS